tara:strand:+ start:531 stop:695 length:165 start_codon:yes stop_codon:yes gene_type:complete
MGGNESKLEKEWQTKNDGSGSFWNNVKRGASQGTKEYVANPGKSSHRLIDLTKR